MASHKDYPMDESDKQALRDRHAALLRGDHEAASAALRRVKGDPVTLKRLKDTYGADHIRQMGYNTELADKVLGPGWLDRDD